MTTILHDMYRYPVKSLGGHALSEVVVQPEGMRGDRRWLITDEKGHFLTARQYPDMLRWRSHIDMHDNLTLVTPDGETHRISPQDCTRQRMVVVWKDNFIAYLAPLHSNEWLQQHLGMACTLYYLGPDSQRMLTKHNIPLTFADSAPYLLTTTASLMALSAAVERPLDMMRFRPNLVITGTQPWAEECWATVRIGEVAFRFLKYCTRCSMINMNIHTAATSRDNQPLQYLKETHCDIRHRPIFGIYLIALNQGVIRIGDQVEITGYHEPMLNTL